MKQNIVTLVMGILIGAILTSGVFLIFDNQSKNPMQTRGNMQIPKDGNFIPGEFKNKGQTDNLETNNI